LVPGDEDLSLEAVMHGFVFGPGFDLEQVNEALTRTLAATDRSCSGSLSRRSFKPTISLAFASSASSSP
jgi:hypothetical protein